MATRLSATDLRRLARRMSLLAAPGGDQLQPKLNLVRQQLMEAGARIAELERHLAATLADAIRYRWLRSADLGAVHIGGIFIGVTPDNLVINEEDADQRIDAAMGADPAEISGSIPCLTALSKPQPQPTPPPQVPDHPLRQEARQLFAAGMFGRSVADDLGLPLDLVSAWADEWRTEQRQARQR